MQDKNRLEDTYPMYIKKQKQMCIRPILSEKERDMGNLRDAFSATDLRLGTNKEQKNGRI